MCDFSTWAPAIGEFLGGAGGEAGAFAGGLGEGVAGIPSVAEDFGSLIGGLIGPGGAAGVADTVGGFMPAVPGPVAEVGLAPMPTESPFNFGDYPLDEVRQFPVNVANAQNAGTVALTPIAQTPQASPGANLGLTLPFEGANVPYTPTPPDAGIGGAFKDATGFLRENYKWMLPALGIGYSALKPSKPVPGAAQQEAYAQRGMQIGQQLTDPLLTGQLPPAYQSAFDRMQKGAEAAIKSKYAQMGLSGSSMERSELAAVPQQLETQKLQIAQNMASQGLQAMGLGSSAYASIANATLARDKELSNALAAFGAAAMRG